MKITIPILTLALAAFSFLSVSDASAHCQVPCGIYHDQLRFESMLEDQETIAKAGVQLAELIQENTPLNANQAGRWIVTKEDHCTKIMDTVSEYFMAQRIKPDAENYEEQLAAAHTLMLAAMKAKQDPSAEVAEAVKTAIFDLYRAYEGKEPDFHKHSH